MKITDYPHSMEAYTEYAEFADTDPYYLISLGEHEEATGQFDIEGDMEEFREAVDNEASEVHYAIATGELTAEEEFDALYHLDCCR